jgi:1-acyl-sn-glycerol-3-phosphate acyltransferase
VLPICNDTAAVNFFKEVVMDTNSEFQQSRKDPVDIYRIVYPLAKLVLDRKYQSTIIHPENILDEPAIYAANHIHAVDSLLLTEAYTEETHNPMRFVVKKGYTEGTGIDDRGKFGRTAKFIIDHTLHVPVSREGSSKEEYKEFEDRVAATFARGDSLGIHPEATRSKDGKLYRFKAGAARLAIANQVPIIPVGLVYNTHSNSRKTNVDIAFGEPIFPEELQSRPYSLLPGTKNKADYMTQVLENRVADLTGMSQTGVFAVLRKLRNNGPHE